MASKLRDNHALTLRDYLRLATASSHDLLDASMRPAADWRSAEDYARFLGVQYAARVSVEHWLSRHAPAELRPPEQTPLIVRDLVQMGKAIETPHIAFELAPKGKASMIGIAWVLAGSSLGNRAMLHDMRRALSKGDEWPNEFLSSTAMIEFWKALRARVEVPVVQEIAVEATEAATRVFEHFLRTAPSYTSGSALERSF